MRRRGEHPCHLGALSRRGHGEPFTQTAASRVDPQLATCLGIHEVEETDVGQLLLAGITHLDGDDVVVSGELGADRRHSRSRKSETTTTSDR